MTAASPLRVGVVVFPGINTDGDTHFALETFPGVTAEYLWHKDTDLKDVDGVVNDCRRGDARALTRCELDERFSVNEQRIMQIRRTGCRAVHCR